VLVKRSAEKEEQEKLKDEERKKSLIAHKGEHCYEHVLNYTLQCDVAVLPEYQ
jgi:hypothetical protein